MLDNYDNMLMLDSYSNYDDAFDDGVRFIIEYSSVSLFNLL